MEFDASAADAAYYYVYENEKLISKHTQEFKAAVSAINHGIKCKCDTKVTQSKTLTFKYSDVIVSLSWDAPQERVNGTTLNQEEIYGYKIRHEFFVGNINKHDMEVDAGFHSFGVSVVDSFGQESEFSNRVEIQVK